MFGSIYNFFLDINKFFWIKDFIIIFFVWGIFVFFINRIKKIYFKNENKSFIKRIIVKTQTKKILIPEKVKYEKNKKIILKGNKKIIKKPQRYNDYN